MTQNYLKIAIIAGEPSGDQLGAALMQALQKKHPHIHFIGIGGQNMEKQGLKSLFPMHELSIIGLWGILKNLLILRKRLQQTVQYLQDESPCVLITIDAPEFCLRVAQKLHKSGIKLVHYTAPTVWAWRPGRARKIAKFLDHLLAIYPFEPKYFTPHNLPTTFIGHAVTEKGIDAIDPNLFRNQNGLHNKTIFTIMPGSRRSEINTLMPIFKQVIANLHITHPDMVYYLPASCAVKPLVQLHLQNFDVPVHIIANEQEKYFLMRSSDAVLAASGTVALELTMANVPFIIAYKVSKLSEIIMRCLLKVRYICIVNIIAQRSVIPEMLQSDCNAVDITAQLEQILDNPQTKTKLKADLSEIQSMLLPVTQEPPSEKAAQIILEIIKKQ